MYNYNFNTYLLVIEKYTENVRFCLICNYLSKIIPAVQSRCTRFRFGPLTPDQMVSRLHHVIQQEQYVILFISIIYMSVCSLATSEDGIESVITLSQGDMRRALNILQVHRNEITGAALIFLIEYFNGL